MLNVHKVLSEMVGGSNCEIPSKEEEVEEEEDSYSCKIRTDTIGYDPLYYDRLHLLDVYWRPVFCIFGTLFFIFEDSHVWIKMILVNNIMPPFPFALGILNSR